MNARQPAGLGGRIKRARERKRWKQQQLADALGVNRKTIDNWENDRTSPRSSIGALEEVLGVSLSEEAEPEDWQQPEDDWEQAILDDPKITGREKREIILRSRRVRRELYPGVRLRRPPAQPADPERETGTG